ncbi:hypothetical protein WICPIJ_001560 [Wickerhamomyces pijperi]|uniref:Uncharacterized protein n=1 Tax=Wickerhamomyces pijperi TaxID=599730 RepID=A0A9P8QD16_WICPI|nr:hypothetical protein WICPIJ_001560 [Wickerhamomyces pijperi]
MSTATGLPEGKDDCLVERLERIELDAVDAVVGAAVAVVDTEEYALNCMNMTVVVAAALVVVVDSLVTSDDAVDAAVDAAADAVAPVAAESAVCTDCTPELQQDWSVCLCGS